MGVLGPKLVKLIYTCDVLLVLSSGWKDGLLLSVLRKAAQQQLQQQLDAKEDNVNHLKSVMKWVTLDGQLDGQQMDTFMTLMGSTRTLSSVSNETIRIPESVKILWEVVTYCSSSMSHCRLLGMHVKFFSIACSCCF